MKDRSKEWRDTVIPLARQIKKQLGVSQDAAFRMARRKIKDARKCSDPR